MDQLQKAVSRIEALRESIADIPAINRTKAEELNWYTTTARIDELKDFFNIEDPLPGFCGAANESDIEELERQIFGLQMELNRKKRVFNAYRSKAQKHP